MALTVSLDERIARLPQRYQNRAQGWIRALEAEAADEFTKSVQSLPPELYQMVWELTFKVVPGIVHIRKDYQPPSMLQVDRQSRRNYAEVYYTDTIFECIDEWILCSWLDQMHPTHWLKLTEVRCNTRVPPPVTHNTIDVIDSKYAVRELLRSHNIYLTQSLYQKTWREGQPEPTWTNWPYDKALPLSPT